MLITRFLILTFFIPFTLYCQQRNIRGVITDKITNKPIDNVQVTHSSTDTVIFTDINGVFIFGKQKVHNDTLYFKHSKYYPQKRFIDWAHNINKQVVKLIPLPNNDISEHILNDYNKYIEGIIIEKKYGLPVRDAVIDLNTSVNIVSDEKGNFYGMVSDTTSSIHISHPEFSSQTIRLRSTASNYSNLKIELKRTVFNNSDSMFILRKNMFGIAANEVINGAFALRYQRFFSNLAVGIHNSFYIAGKGPNFMIKTNKYFGVKIAPYFRLYTDRINRFGGYLEGKGIAGYFDYDVLWYGYPPDIRRGASYTETFWSYGFGFGGGYYTFLPKSNRFVFNIYAGFQYFPMIVPETRISSSYGELKVEKGGWYLFGPGSILEVKIIFSMVF